MRQLRPKPRAHQSEAHAITSVRSAPPFKWDYTSGTKVDRYIDGVLVASPTGVTAFNQITRTTGWHEFTWDYTSGTKVDLYIDGALVASPTGVTNFKRVEIGDLWSGNTNTSYFDDIAIQ